MKLDKDKIPKSQEEKRGRRGSPVISWLQKGWGGVGSAEHLSEENAIKRQLLGSETQEEMKILGKQMSRDLNGFAAKC